MNMISLSLFRGWSVWVEGVDNIALHNIYWQGFIKAPQLTSVFALNIEFLRPRVIGKQIKYVYTTAVGQGVL